MSEGEIVVAIPAILAVICAMVAVYGFTLLLADDPNGVPIFVGGLVAALIFGSLTALLGKSAS